jgi:catechol 2,3-dioxygenase-like lactoylglutathione lyase family enzyme
MPFKNELDENMIRYNGVNHIALITSNMDETIRFWRDLLGIRLVFALGEPGYRQYFFEISPQNLVVFFEWPDVEPLEEKDAGMKAKGKIAFDHLCIEVDNEESLWELKDKFDAADIWTTELSDHYFLHSFFTFDPNGIALEFCYRVKGVEIQQKPLLLDSRPSDVTKEGFDPQPNIWPEVQESTLSYQRKVYPGNLSILFNVKNVKK